MALSELAGLTVVGDTSLNVLDTEINLIAELVNLLDNGLVAGINIFICALFGLLLKVGDIFVYLLNLLVYFDELPLLFLSLSRFIFPYHGQLFAHLLHFPIY